MFFFKAALAAPLLFGIGSAQVAKTVCGGKNYTYDSLAGYGLVPSNARG
jgi:hypothetical protein